MYRIEKVIPATKEAVEYFEEECNNTAKEKAEKSWRYQKFIELSDKQVSTTGTLSSAKECVKRFKQTSRMSVDDYAFIIPFYEVVTDEDASARTSEAIKKEYIKTWKEIRENDYYKGANGLFGKFLKPSTTKCNCVNCGATFDAQYIKENKCPICGGDMSSEVNRLNARKEYDELVHKMEDLLAEYEEVQAKSLVPKREKYYYAVYNAADH